MNHNAKQSTELQEMITEWTVDLSPEEAQELRDMVETAFELGFEDGHEAGWDAQAQATPY